MVFGAKIFVDSVFFSMLFYFTNFWFFFFFGQGVIDY